jgi:hypothetical protein
LTRNQRFFLPSLVSAAVLAAAGCRAQPAADRTPAPAASSSASTGAATAPPRADALLAETVQSRQDTWYLRRVEDELVRRCMAGKGLTYFATEFGPIPAEGAATVDAIPPAPAAGYGLFAKAKAGAADEATTPGRTLPGAVGAPSRNRQDVYVQRLGPAEQAKYLEALQGPDSTRATITLPTGSQISFPTGGCRGDARRQVYGDLADAVRLDMVPQSVLRQVATRAQADPEYATAIAAWQACMRKAGYPYRSPLDATVAIAGAYRTQGVTETLHRRELAVARADATCDAASSLREVSARMRAKYLDQMSDEIERDLVALAELRTDAVARAKSLLRTG